MMKYTCIASLISCASAAFLKIPTGPPPAAIDPAQDDFKEKVYGEGDDLTEIIKGWVDLNQVRISKPGGAPGAKQIQIGEDGRIRFKLLVRGMARFVYDVPGHPGYTADVVEGVVMYKKVKSQVADVIQKDGMIYNQSASFPGTDTSGDNWLPSDDSLAYKAFKDMAYHAKRDFGDEEKYEDLETRFKKFMDKLKKKDDTDRGIAMKAGVNAAIGKPGMKLNKASEQKVDDAEKFLVVLTEKDLHKDAIDMIAKRMPWASNKGFTLGEDAMDTDDSGDHIKSLKKFSKQVKNTIAKITIFRKEGEVVKETSHLCTDNNTQAEFISWFKSAAGAATEKVTIEFKPPGAGNAPAMFDISSVVLKKRNRPKAISVPETKKELTELQKKMLARRAN